MSIGEFLRASTKKLTAAGIGTARLDCLVFLEDALGHNRAWLLAHEEAEIDQSTEVALNTKIVQRIKHVPLAYLRGKAEFYGREFSVNRHVLVPRPESEAIIDLLKQIEVPAGSSLPLRIIDVGSGSGCLGITAALELANSEVELWDIDNEALAVAMNNAAKHSVSPMYRQADLLTPPPEVYVDIFLANLPYVPTNYPINRAAAHEPKFALYGGEDGLDLYRRFWQQLTDLKTPSLYVLTESLLDQHQTMLELAQRAGFHHVAQTGLAQQFRRHA